MTDRYSFVGRINRQVNYRTTSAAVSLFASSGGYFGFFVRDLRTNELMLPVKVGSGFAVVAENGLPLMAAFPARLGNQAGEWINVCPKCPVTDLANMPSVGGMMEALPNSNVKFDGLLLPGGKKAPFVVNPGGAEYNGKNFDRIEVGYRFPTNPNAIHGARPDIRPKGGSVVIDAGPTVSGEREVTNLSYLQQAHSFGVVRIVDRAKLAALLAADGAGKFDPENDQHWSSHYLRDIGKADRLTDIELAVK